MHKLPETKEKYVDHLPVVFVVCMFWCNFPLERRPWTFCVWPSLASFEIGVCRKLPSLKASEPHGLFLELIRLVFNLHVFTYAFVRTRTDLPILLLIINNGTLCGDMSSLLQIFRCWMKVWMNLSMPTNALLAVRANVDGCPCLQLSRLSWNWHSFFA